MSVDAIRLTRRQYIDSALTGEGARLFGGRFNSLGRSVVYASATLSLAVLEILVHAVRPSDLAGYVGLRLAFDEALVEDVGPLPEYWRDNSWPAAVQSLGDRWLDEERSAILRVPSAVLPSESNYLLNPRHPAFAQVRHEVVDVDIDERVYRLGQ